MRFSEALNAMFRGHKVALRSEPGTTYTFDGAEGMRIWAYHDATDDFIHIDNVDFDRMMKGDWYVIPQARYHYQHSSRQWSILNHLTVSRFSKLDAFGIASFGIALIDVGAYWWVGLIGATVGFIGSLLARKWRTNV